MNLSYNKKIYNPLSSKNPNLFWHNCVLHEIFVTAINICIELLPEQQLNAL